LTLAKAVGEACGASNVALYEHFDQILQKQTATLKALHVSVINSMAES